MKKVLIFEDDKGRIETFKKAFPNADYAKNYNEATEFLINNMYDVVFLDHDIEGEEKTGYDIAHFMRDNQKICANIIIHSMNTVGAKNIIDTIPNAIHIPFFKIINFLCSFN